MNSEDREELTRLRESLERIERLVKSNDKGAYVWLERLRKMGVDEAIKSGVVVGMREHEDAVEEARTEEYECGKAVAIARVETIAQLCAEVLEEL